MEMQSREMQQAHSPYENLNQTDADSLPLSVPKGNKDIKKMETAG